MMLYGKTQCCISTYNVANVKAIKQQYNKCIDCSTNNCNTAHVTQFIDAAESVINTLKTIINTKEFIFDRNVSLNDRSVYNTSLDLISIFCRN